MSDQFVGFEIIFHTSVDPVPTTTTIQETFFILFSSADDVFHIIEKIIHRIDCAVPLEKNLQQNNAKRKSRSRQKNTRKK